MMERNKGLLGATMLSCVDVIFSTSLPAAESKNRTRIDDVTSQPMLTCQATELSKVVVVIAIYGINALCESLMSQRTSQTLNDLKLMKLSLRAASPN